MTRATQDKTEAPQAAHEAPETQHQRWLKYGANVVLSILLVLALTAVLVWGTGKYRKRLDTTYSGSYSLKPQTVNLIRDLDRDVTLVCLYPKLKQTDDANEQDFRQPVLDLLNEYRAKSSKINVRVIDSVNDLTQYSAWIKEVKSKYGGNIGAYENALREFPPTLTQISAIADQESDRFGKLIEKFQSGELKVTTREQAQTLNLIATTIGGFPDALQELRKQIEADTKQIEKSKTRIRDYKGQKDAVQDSLAQFAALVDMIKTRLDQLKADEKVPAEFRSYATESLPRFDEMKKQADALVKKLKDLGDLKLDELRQKLQPPEEGKAPESAIAVMGPDDIKLISFEDVWKSGETFGMASREDMPKLRFAGEQKITSAILSLTQTQKPKVAFVRSGGQPLVTGGFDPMMRQPREPMMKELADRLRSYNFDVIEKDFGRQADPSMGPTPAEPSDAELRNAVWLVYAGPPSMMGPAGGDLASKLEEHLQRGGSALVLIGDFDGSMPRPADAMSSVLKNWGIEAKTDALVLHESIKAAAGASSDDMIERAKREPPVFVLSQYGTHPIAKSVQALDSVFVFAIPIETSKTPPAGISVSPLLPVPTAPKAWGERDFASIRPDEEPTYTSGSDLPGPLSLGAAAEKSGGGRLVVIGSVWAAFDMPLTFPDMKLREKYKINVSRFPGNGELMTNSIFWLGKKEGMMALSPSAMEVSRIAPLSSGSLFFWRVGVLLILLPLLVIGAGVMVYISRRD